MITSALSNFQVQDRVWLYNPCKRKGLLPKLMSDWEGLSYILEKLSNVTGVAVQ